MIHADGATKINTPSSPEASIAVPMDYARALRAIGQDLTSFFPKTLEIETDGVNFAARGQSHPNPFQRVKESTLKRTWVRLFGNDANLHSPDQQLAAAFARSYTPEDLEGLDRAYRANRTGELKRPDSYSLAERLRTMGSIVSARKGRLKQLRKNGDHLCADYWDPNGNLQTANLTTVILYREPEPDDSGREPRAPKEAWEGYDF